MLLVSTLLSETLALGSYSHDFYLGWVLSIATARARLIRWLLTINEILFTVALVVTGFVYFSWSWTAFVMTPGWLFLFGWAVVIGGLEIYGRVFKKEIEKKIKALGQPVVSLAIIDLGKDYFLLLKRIGKSLLRQKIVHRPPKDGGAWVKLLAEIHLPGEKPLITGAFLLRYEGGADFLDDSIRVLHLLSDAIGEGTVDLDQSVRVQLREI